MPAAEPLPLPSLESLAICNINDRVLSHLLPNDANRIRNRRTTIRNNVLLKPGRFPADIRVLENVKQAIKEAKREAEKAYEERVLILWTAGDYQ